MWIDDFRFVSRSLNLRLTPRQGTTDQEDEIAQRGWLPQTVRARTPRALGCRHHAPRATGSDLGVRPQAAARHGTDRGIRSTGGTSRPRSIAPQVTLASRAKTAGRFPTIDDHQLAIPGGPETLSADRTRPGRPNHDNAPADAVVIDMKASPTRVQSWLGLICPHLPKCSRRPPFLDDLTGRFVWATETPSISLVLRRLRRRRPMRYRRCTAEGGLSWSLVSEAARSARRVT